jgi:hypothetical protein
MEFGKQSSMAFAIFVLVCALCISGVAAYYSIIGLMALFAGSALAIAIMGGVLEVGKLVTASWLYNTWTRAPKLIRAYLSFSVLVLMFITSMGIFGFLSKAHLAQIGPSDNVAAKIEKLDFGIEQQQNRIDRANHILGQFDKALEVYFEKEYVTRGLKERAKQQEEREALQEEIQDANAKIDVLTEKKFEEQKELRGIEAEVGPIKYISELVYGEEEASKHIDKAVRFVIIILIFVFDPLAVLLVIAGNISIQHAREAKSIRGPPKQPPKKKEKEEVEVKEEEVAVVEDPPKEKETILTLWASKFKNEKPEALDLPVIETQEVEVAEEEPVAENIPAPYWEGEDEHVDHPVVVELTPEQISEAFDTASQAISFNMDGQEGAAFRRAFEKAVKRPKDD